MNKGIRKLQQVQITYPLSSFNTNAGNPGQKNSTCAIVMQHQDRKLTAQSGDKFGEGDLEAYLLSSNFNSCIPDALLFNMFSNNLVNIPGRLNTAFFSFPELSY